MAFSTPAQNPLGDASTTLSTFTYSSLVSEEIRNVLVREVNGALARSRDAFAVLERQFQRRP